MRLVGLLIYSHNFLKKSMKISVFLIKMHCVISEIRTEILNITYINFMLRGYNKFQWNTSFSVNETVTHRYTLRFRQLFFVLTRKLHAYGKSVRRSTYNRCNMLVTLLEYSKALPYSQVIRLNILILQQKKRLCIYSFFFINDLW